MIIRPDYFINSDNQEAGSSNLSARPVKEQILLTEIMMLTHPAFVSKIPGIEIAKDYDGIYYLTYPLYSGTALEVEEQEGMIYIVFRKWNMSHALTEEIDIAEVSVREPSKAIALILMAISNNT